MKLTVEVRIGKTRTIDEADLRHWQLLERFFAVLDEVGGEVPASKREGHGLRRLERRAYLGLFLFGLFNPVVRSLRGLCAATALPQVQAVAGARGPVGLSRFSDAQHVFAPEVLEPVVRQLLAQSLARAPLAEGRGRISPQMLRVVDSTVWKVLPRMQWAQWRHQYQEQRAVRLHVKLRLADLHPVSAVVTPGKTCERAALRAALAPGEFYVGDRYYGEDYAFFEQLEKARCGFLLRLRNQAVLRMEKEHPLPAAAAAHGIKSDALMWLGARGARGPWRVVRFQKPHMAEEVILVASAECAEVSALELADLYGERWQVEMYFRWLKCLVPCRHWFAESRAGVQMQVYLALIEALLLSEVAGRKPNVRMMELLHWHQLGMIDDALLAARLRHEQQQARRRQERAAAKKLA